MENKTINNVPQLIQVLAEVVAENTAAERAERAAAAAERNRAERAARR